METFVKYILLKRYRFRSWPSLFRYHNKITFGSTFIWHLFLGHLTLLPKDILFRNLYLTIFYYFIKKIKRYTFASVHIVSLPNNATCTYVYVVKVFVLAWYGFVCMWKYTRNVMVWIFICSCELRSPCCLFLCPPSSQTGWAALRRAGRGERACSASRRAALCPPARRRKRRVLVSSMASTPPTVSVWGLYDHTLVESLCIFAWIWFDLVYNCGVGVIGGWFEQPHLAPVRLIRVWVLGVGIALTRARWGCSNQPPTTHTHTHM